MKKRPIIDVAHISSRGTSYRLTIPKKIIRRLNLGSDDIIAFYEDDGVKIDKIQ